jgi:hypothetical protein
MVSKINYLIILNNMNPDMKDCFLTIKNKLSLHSKEETVDVVLNCTNNSNLEKILNKINGELIGRN